MFKRALLKGDNISLRCYARQDGDQFIAACLDLCLAAQAETMEDAKRKLHEQVVDYLVDAFAENDLETRPAPFSEWVRYFSIVSRVKTRRLAGSLNDLGKLATTSGAAFREEVRKSSIASA